MKQWLQHGVLLGVLVLASPAHAQPDPADQLLAEGMELGKKSQWQEARAKIAEAWKLKKSYDIAGNLGLVEVQVGDYAAAAEHLDYARRTIPAHVKPEKRKRIEDQLAEAKAKVGCARVTVNVDGSRLKLGDRTLGPTPTDDLLCAAPGTHTLTIERDGYASQQKFWSAQANKEERLEIVLQQQGSGGGGAGAAGGEGGSGGEGLGGGAGGTVGSGGEGGGAPDGGKPVWPAAVLGGVAAAGLAIGISGIVLSVQNAGNADDAQADLPDGACTGPDQGPCAAITDSLDEASSFRAMGIAGFTIAGLAGIGAIIYAAVPADDKSSTAVRVTPVLGSTNGFVLEGTF
ncbi:MAG: PEGA domain-containing protein [Polyangiaceae bacterium]|nr:PEGA domain-containing protein [Polyangiaceae bacterium]